MYKKPFWMEHYCNVRSTYPVCAHLATCVRAHAYSLGEALLRTSWKLIIEPRGRMRQSEFKTLTSLVSSSSDLRPGQVRRRLSTNCWVFSLSFSYPSVIIQNLHTVITPWILVENGDNSGGCCAYVGCSCSVVSWNSCMPSDS